MIKYITILIVLLVIILSCSYNPTIQDTDSCEHKHTKVSWDGIERCMECGQEIEYSIDVITPK